METGSFSDDLRRYLAVLRHWAWLLLLATILGGVGGYVSSIRTTPIYQASTTVLINQAPATQSSEYASLITSERLAQTYAQLMTKEPTLERVVDELELEISAGYIRANTSVSPIPDTQLIEVRVEDTTPQRAALIADALVNVFADYYNEEIQAVRFSESKANLEAQLEVANQQIEQTNAQLASISDEALDLEERDRLEAKLAQFRQTYAGLLQSYEQVRVAEAQSTSDIVPVEPASASSRPIRPKTAQNIALGAMVGFMLATGVVILMEALDDTVKGPDDITRHLGLPVLGLIAKVKQNGDGPITAMQPRSPVAEAFRALRTNIQFASVDYPISTLLITSPSPKDGKTTVASNLSVALAQSGRKVVVVDTDLRRPTIHRRMKLANRKGLSDLFVQNQVDINGTMRDSSIPNLSVITSGSLPPNPAELIGSEKMFTLLSEMKDEADIIVLDSPPVMAVTDPAVLAPRVDGVILVIRPGTTKLGASKQAVEQLVRSGAQLLGVVLNDVDLKRSRYNYYYKNYYYSYYNTYTDDDSPSSSGRPPRLGRQEPATK
ncbi:MAG: polysaccharide biosynthesis tyrosine autokinase [Anaerolineales bacterium]|nr:polysaccharide biosynthesis tyrosine autokinase [Anaerolineales bacterium]